MTYVNVQHIRVEAPENGRELSYSAHANGMNDLYVELFGPIWQNTEHTKLSTAHC